MRYLVYLVSLNLFLSTIKSKKSIFYPSNLIFGYPDYCFSYKINTFFSIKSAKSSLKFFIYFRKHFIINIT